MFGLARSEARLPRWMILIAVVGIVGLFIMNDGRAGLGFAIGTFLGILNYYWLHESGHLRMQVWFGHPKR